MVDVIGKQPTPTGPTSSSGAEIFPTMQFNLNL